MRKVVALLEEWPEVRDLLEAIKKYIEETDYCIVCDCHASHGHAEDCSYFNMYEL